MRFSSVANACLPSEATQVVFLEDKQRKVCEPFSRGSLEADYSRDNSLLSSLLACVVQARALGLFTYLAYINLSVGVLVVGLKEGLLEFGQNFIGDCLSFKGGVASASVVEMGQARTKGEREIVVVVVCVRPMKAKLPLVPSD